MKKSIFLFGLLLFLEASVFAQDFEIKSFEWDAENVGLFLKRKGHNNMAAILISTKNISAENRKHFTFSTDAGSKCEIDAEDYDGSILLWVKTPLKFLKIGNSKLGGSINIDIKEAYGISISKPKQVFKIQIEGTMSTDVGKGPCSLYLDFTPQDADLNVNGLNVGAQGGQVFHALPGEYQCSVTAELYREVSKKITLKAGQTDTLRVVLEPAYGYLSVKKADAPNDSCDVFLNETLIGKAPFRSGKMSLGKNTIKLKKGGNTILTQEIEIKEKKITEISINAKDNKKADVAYSDFVGKISLTSEPEGASAFLDGLRKGTTPCTIEDVTIGEHKIVLKKDGYFDSNEKKVTVSEDETTKCPSINLEKGCWVYIKTDKPDAKDNKPDAKIYVDGKDNGISPQRVLLHAGKHTIKAEWNGYAGEKNCDFEAVKEQDTVSISFGRNVVIETGNSKDRIYVDGHRQGNSPIETYLGNGKHELLATHGWRSIDTLIIIKSDTMKDSGTMKVMLETQLETAEHYISSGVFFATGNVAFPLSNSKPSFGLSFGSVKKFGWYVSMVSGTDFKALKTSYTADENGFIDGVLPLYSGVGASSRLSVIAGLVYKVYGPVFLRAGAGYGIRSLAWEAKGDVSNWIQLKPYSWQNVEASIGVQACIYNIAVNIDLVTPVDAFTNKFISPELRIGIGGCIRKKGK